MATNKTSDTDLFIKHNWPFIVILAIVISIYFLRNYLAEKLKLFFDFIEGENILNYIILLLILYLLFILFRHFMKKKRIIWCRYMPHLSDETNSDKIKFMLAEINKVRLKRLTRWTLGNDWKSFMIRKDEDGNIYYYFAFDKSLIIEMQSALRKSYLNAKLDYVGDDSIPFPIKKKDKKSYVGGRMNATRKAKKRMLSFKRFKHDHLPNIVAALPNDSFLKVDFKRSEKKRALRKIRGSEEDIKEVQTKDRTGRQKLELRNLQHRMQGSEVGFSSLISLATKSENGYQGLKSTSNAIATALEDDASLYYRKYKGGITKYPTIRPTLSMLDGGVLFLTGSEISNIIHLPNYSDDSELIEKLRDKTDMHDKTIDLLDNGLFDNEDGIKVGFVKLANGAKRMIKVSLEALKDHVAITGKTGSGKSSFIVAILDGLLKGHFDEDNKDKAVGLTFLDPGQDTALTLYNRLLKYYNEGGDVDWRKINYLSLKDSDFPLAMNLLDKDIGTYSDTSLSSIAEAISDIIESAMPSEAPVAKRLLAKCIETLLADEEAHTILDVKLLVKNTTYRNKIIGRIKDNPANYEIVEYWATDAEENLKTSETALMNRLEVFTSSPVLKRMFGQNYAEFNFRTILDEGHINLLDMTGLSQSEMRIIGGYLSYRFYKASIGRPRNSRLHILGFDETKVLGKMPYLSKIIAETRKFNLAGLVGAQMFSQLDTELKRSMQDVQDNFISCLQGSSEAKEVAGFLSDKRVQIEPDDLTRLNPKLREGYIALKDTVKGETDRYTMKVQIDPPVKYGMNGQVVEYQSEEEKEAVDTSLLIAHMRRKFKPGVKHKSEVDLEIIRRMNPNDDLSHLSVTDIKRMSDEDKEALNQELEELELIRNAEILPGQVKLFYRQEQATDEEKKQSLEQSQTASDPQVEDIHDDEKELEEKEVVSLTLMESLEVEESPNENVDSDKGKGINEKKSKNSSKKVSINRQGLYSLREFVDQPPTVPKKKVNTIENVEIAESTENDNTSKSQQDEPKQQEDSKPKEQTPHVDESSTNTKSQRRRKISDLQ
ncbi:helicase HerA domain-containing protein [Staphylococcus warneri]|uniref:helicase HerA domain-containing protein n=1 Tax=Staphylococcus warneri TaxID=1292 RepID=UPI00326188AE